MLVTTEIDIIFCKINKFLNIILDQFRILKYKEKKLIGYISYEILTIWVWGVKIKTHYLYEEIGTLKGAQPMKI